MRTQLSAWTLSWQLLLRSENGILIVCYLIYPHPRSFSMTTFAPNTWVSVFLPVAVLFNMSSPKVQASSQLIPTLYFPFNSSILYRPRRHLSSQPRSGWRRRRRRSYYYCLRFYSNRKMERSVWDRKLALWEGEREELTTAGTDWKKATIKRKRQKTQVVTIRER